MEELKVTTIEDIKKYTEGNIVELPPFSNGQRFIAKLKRPSLMGLVSQGKIPNPLIGVVNEIFSGKFDDILQSGDKDTLKILWDVTEIIIPETLAEPTYEQIKEIGLELTDEQRIVLFNYGQTGVTNIIPFLEK